MSCTVEDMVTHGGASNLTKRTPCQCAINSSSQECVYSTLLFLNHSCQCRTPMNSILEEGEPAPMVVEHPASTAYAQHLTETPA